MPSNRRYADWRPVPVRRMPARWIGLLVACLLGMAVSIWRHAPSHFVYMVAAALGVFVSNRVAARRLDHLRDEGDDRQFGATLRLKCGTVYGHDEGLISFEDGYLVYMGRRCTFSVGAQDVHVVEANTGKSSIEFVFKGPVGKHEAHLELRRNASFLESVAAWSAAGRRSKDRVLPPAFPDPSLPLLAVVTMNVLPLVALTVALAAFVDENPNLQLVVFGFALLLMVAVVTLGATQYRTLRRIVRKEKKLPSLISRLRLRRHRRVSISENASAPTATNLSSPSDVAAPVEVRTNG